MQMQVHYVRISCAIYIFFETQQQVNVREFEFMILCWQIWNLMYNVGFSFFEWMNAGFRFTLWMETKVVSYNFECITILNYILYEKYNKCIQKDFLIFGIKFLHFNKPNKPNLNKG